VPNPHAPLKFGAHVWNAFTDWPTYVATMQSAERLGYDSLWTPDHMYPSMGAVDGPMFEAYTALAAVATKTERAAVGLLVGANTFRNPALVAKMVTTLDHISGGRAVLGVGAGWHAEEHRDFGFPYGSGPPDRLRWLGEALPIMRGMLDGERPSATDGRYRSHEAINEPAPLQPHLPLLVAGGGPRVTLGLVAQYGDANNLSGPPEVIVEKERLLLEHCDRVGRDEREIERTMRMAVAVIRDSRAEAERVHESIFETAGAEPWPNDPVGTPEDLYERCAAYVELGYRHLIFYFPAPYDDETMARLHSEVRPRLEAMLKA
jgi:alkanesulfonate monooxygenase SsuD/methylene tetrahydromethanopterin reductase-like flavin-dependent oxidoreductase (luciferase family)